MDVDELVHRAPSSRRRRLHSETEGAVGPEREELDRQALARAARVPARLEGEQAVEESAIPSECLPQILGRGLLAV